MYPPTVYLFQPGLTHVVHGLYAWIYTHPSYIQQVTVQLQTSQPPRPEKMFTDKKWALKNIKWFNPPLWHYPNDNKTKKTLLLLLLMSVEWIHVVHTKMTEGAQEGLLCVHTMDVCILHMFCCPWGNVTVPTPVLILVGPQFNHYGHLNESRCPQICHGHQLLSLPFFFLHWLCLHRSCWGWRSRSSRRSRGHRILELP